MALYHPGESGLERTLGVHPFLVRSHVVVSSKRCIYAWDSRRAPLPDAALLWASAPSIIPPGALSWLFAGILAVHRNAGCSLESWLFTGTPAVRRGE